MYKSMYRTKHVYICGKWKNVSQNQRECIQSIQVSVILCACGLWSSQVTLRMHVVQGISGPGYLNRESASQEHHCNDYEIPGNAQSV